MFQAEGSAEAEGLKVVTKNKNKMQTSDVGDLFSVDLAQPAFENGTTAQSSLLLCNQVCIQMGTDISQEEGKVGETSPWRQAWQGHDTFNNLFQT